MSRACTGRACSRLSNPPASSRWWFSLFCYLVAKLSGRDLRAFFPIRWEIEPGELVGEREDGRVIGFGSFLLVLEVADEEIASIISELDEPAILAGRPGRTLEAGTEIPIRGE